MLPVDLVDDASKTGPIAAHPMPMQVSPDHRHHIFPKPKSTPRTLNFSLPIPPPMPPGGGGLLSQPYV